MGAPGHLFNPPESGASTVVTNLTEAALQAAITAGGIVSVVGSGTIAITTGLTFPDKNVVLHFDPRVTLAPAGAISLFTIPNGLTADRWYVLHNPVAVGSDVANQWFMTFSDAASKGNVSIFNPNVTAIRNIFNHTAGDTNFDRAAIVEVWGGQICPTGDGAGYILKTAHTASNAPTFAASHYFDGCRVWTPAATNGFLMDYGGDLYVGGEEFFLSGASKVCGLTMFKSAVIGGNAADGSDTLEVFQRSWDATTMGAGFLIGITLKLSQGSGNPALIEGMILGLGSKIQVNGDHATLSNIVQRESNPGTPDYVVDVLAGADNCRIVNGRFHTASAGLIRNAAQKLIVIGCHFAAGAAIETIDDVGAGDYTLGVGNIGVSTGGGLSIAANSKVTVGDYNFA